jgi:Predicted transcriptional regulators
MVLNVDPLGGIIRDRRKELGMTQKDLAVKSGMEQSYISALERGEKETLTSITLNKLAEALNLSIDYLMFGYDRTLFIKYVGIIIGTKPINQFAEETGIDQTEILKIIEGHIIEQPSFEVVKKIADYNPYDIVIDRASLYKAAGYTIEAKQFGDIKTDVIQNHNFITTNDEQSLITRFRKLSPTSQATVMNLLESLEKIEKSQAEQASTNEVG